MQVVVLSAMVLTFGTTFVLVETTSSDWVSPGVFGPLLGLYVLGSATLAAAHTRRAMRGVEPSAGPGGQRSLRRLSLLRHLWLVLGSPAVAAAGYGPWVMTRLMLPWLTAQGTLEPQPMMHIPLLGELLLLAPFVACLLIGWSLDYPYHRAVRERIRREAPAESSGGIEWWSRREYMLYNVRHHLLFVLVPVGIIIALDGVLRMLGRWGWFPPGPNGELMLAGLQVACAGGVFLVAPLLVVRIWKTRRLPDGPLRRRLESLCERLGLRYRDILIWQSGGVIANAGAMGLIGPVRYILLSDGILQQMPPERIEAIFAHEAGHIIHHHIAYFGLFAISSILLSVTLGEWAGVVLGDLGALTASAVALAAMWGLAFGWISRRFERQSDVVAAWAMGKQVARGDPGPAITPQGAHVFASALEQVAMLNGFPPDRFNWRHGPISWRVEYVLRLGATGGTRVPIDRLVGRLKRALWASLAVATALTASLAWL